MNLGFNIELATNYSSGSQIARVLTENWVKENSYCPNCGNAQLSAFTNNKPVADFYCGNCLEEFELKSKDGKSVGNKIMDGAYSTMISRINASNNPNFFLLNYDKVSWSVNNFLIIPKHFFVPDIIEKRRPLNDTARRAGWIGCNIEIAKIPKSGRIYLVKNSQVVQNSTVREKWQKTVFLKSKSTDSKGWILDIMSCIDQIKNDTFSLQEIYVFESYLTLKYPNNNHVKDKIRQQLQFLRDKELLQFLGSGRYKKLWE